MSYQERLRNYQREKANLMKQQLTDKQYEREIKKLADKWGI